MKKENVLGMTNIPGGSSQEGEALGFKQACPKCGSDNFHVQSNISFITGKPGFHVCNLCGFTAEFFPKISDQERQNLSGNPLTPKPLTKSDPYNKYDLGAIAAASIIFVFAGIMWFVIAFGGYFSLRYLFSKKYQKN